MSEDEKVRENRLRRMAERQGLQLRKSRRRDPRAPDYGSYWLRDPYSNTLAAGDRWGWTLDEIEEYLGERPNEVINEAFGAGWEIVGKLTGDDLLYLADLDEKRGKGLISDIEFEGQRRQKLEEVEAR